MATMQLQKRRWAETKPPERKRNRKEGTKWGRRTEAEDEEAPYVTKRDNSLGKMSENRTVTNEVRSKAKTKAMGSPSRVKRQSLKINLFALEDFIHFLAPDTPKLRGTVPHDWLSLFLSLLSFRIITFFTWKYYCLFSRKALISRPVTDSDDGEAIVWFGSMREPIFFFGGRVMDHLRYPSEKNEILARNQLILSGVPH